MKPTEEIEAKIEELKNVGNIFSPKYRLSRTEDIIRRAWMRALKWVLDKEEEG